MPPLRRLLPLFAAIALLLSPLPALAADEDFATWLVGMRQQALAAGIHPETVDRAFDGLEPIARVIELDRKQPEGTVTFADYVTRVVDTKRRQAAHQHFIENRALLTKIGRRYGVQPRFIVALWGIETNFGQITGKFPVVAALATLAYNGRRSAFFRDELINALRISEQDHIDPKEMMGSWAGAMGQSQFMPSSFLRYAVSYRNDGKRDIWHRPEDVFASIANYLSQSGWHGNEGWGRRVQVPADFDPALVGLRTTKPLAMWAKLGVRGDGTKLPKRGPQASLIQPDGPAGPSLLVYDNFRVLMKWNSSSYFAGSVGILADSVQ